MVVGCSFGGGLIGRWSGAGGCGAPDEGVPDGDAVEGPRGGGDRLEAERRGVQRAEVGGPRWADGGGGGTAREPEDAKTCGPRICERKMRKQQKYAEDEILRFFGVFAGIHFFLQKGNRIP